MVALAIVPLYAQTTSDSTLSEISDEEVIELSPFEVTATTVGYYATNTAIGGRINQALKDTASAVSVLTSEFVKDVGAINFLEAMKWGTNAVAQAEYVPDNIFENNQVNFRGLGKSFNARDYFLWYVNSDWYNVDRIDISRGPNALVFGDAGVGGIANVSSKRATQKNKVTTSVTAYSTGGIRTFLEVNRSLTEQWAILVSGVYDDHDLWKDNTYYDRMGYYLTTTYRPFKDTRIDANFEWGEVDAAFANEGLEQFSGWDGVTVIERRGQLTPAQRRAAGLVGGTKSNVPSYAFNPARPEWGVYNLNGWYYTTTEFANSRQLLVGDMIDPPSQKSPLQNYYIPSRGWHPAPPNRVNDTWFYTGSFFLQQTLWEKLFVEAAYNRQTQKRDIDYFFWNTIFLDVNKKLSDNTPQNDNDNPDNPYFGELFTEGQWHRQQQKNTIDEYRFSAVYSHAFDPIVNLKWLNMIGLRDERFYLDDWDYAVENGPNPDLNNDDNKISIRRYLRDRDLPYSLPGNDPVSGLRARTYLEKGGYRESKIITYMQTALQAKWWNERITTMTGVRRDTFEKKLTDRENPILDPVTKEVLDYGEKRTLLKETVDTLSLSAVVEIFPWVNATANYGESYFPIGNSTTIDGSTFPAYRSKGHDFGLRFTFLDNKIYANLNYYENEEFNRAYGGNVVSSINSIWNMFDLEEKRLLGYSDTFDVAGHGWEFEIIANPTEELRLTFNLAFPHSEQVNGLAATRNYYAQNKDNWNALANDPQAETKYKDFDPTVYQQRISEIEKYLGGFAEGRKLDDLFEYTANAYVRYTFTSTFLEGLSIGGGVNMRGRRIVDNVIGQPFNYLYAPSYELYSLSLGYQRKIRSALLELQLNIDNLLDKELLLPVDYTIRKGNPQNALPRAYYFVEPLSFRISAMLSF